MRRLRGKYLTKDGQRKPFVLPWRALIPWGLQWTRPVTLFLIRRFTRSSAVGEHVPKNFWLKPKRCWTRMLD
jgi:hypothetical protein